MPQARSATLATRLSGRLASVLIKSWMSTLRYRAAFYDRSVDPALPGDESRIYLFWHENILLPIYLRSGCPLTILLSRHRDADVLAEVARHSGFGCVRGSTYRGAAPAMRELLRKGRQMHLALTPDGPRGPRRHLAQGAVYLASKLCMPIVAIGVGYDRPWRAPTWDRFAIPRPFSRARVVVSPPIHIGRNLDRAGVELSRQRLETLLNRLTEQAQAWAESGSGSRDEEPIGPSRRRRRAA